MSISYQIIPELLLPGQKYDEGTNTLTLKEAGAFRITIKEYADELEALTKEIDIKHQENYDLKASYKNPKPGAPGFDVYEKKKNATNQEIINLEDKKRLVYEKYANLEWCWKLVGNGMTIDNITHNPALEKGLAGFTYNVNNVKSYLELKLNKLIEGGGAAYLEAFTKNDQGIGSYGMLLKATGTPVVIRTEWTDYDYNKITQTVGFGSKVLLHIYTKAMYGQRLKIQLIDQDLFDPNDALEISKKTKITQKVDVHKMHPNEAGKYGVEGKLVNASKNDGATTQYIQKIVVEVAIDYAWSKTAGETLKIYPTLTVPAEATFFKEYERSYIAVKMGEPVVQKPIESGNKPFTVGSSSSQSSKNDGKKEIDFTFGVFIDGTLNSMYNSIARKKWEEDKIKKQKLNPDLPEVHLKIAATEQEDINKINTDNAKRYKFDNDSSFENDLSNPAIIYQNYKKEPENKIFKIYTEGMGTNTMAQQGDDPNSIGVLPVERYEEDDAAGFALGQGKSGIIARVKRAIELIEEKIIIENKQTQKLGTVTVDVFGFSRGAASARNFVHEITRPVYNATRSTKIRTNAFGGITGANRPLVDHNGYEVGEEYEDKLLPKNGRLGWLLAKKNLEIQRLVIRFVGIYDTVPHHGFLQSNDVEDLGLDSVAQANYTVHMVAADEHRKNFSLVDISCITGKKGGGSTKKGIELYLPGVHCDVGGSYVEGRGENIGRLLTNRITNLNNLEAERERLIKEGWFNKDQIFIQEDRFMRNVIQGNGQILSSVRNHISNQYSFIPLHIMVDICKEKGLVIGDVNLGRDYIFKKTKFSDPSFLKEIEKKLKAYAQGGKIFQYEHQTVPQRTIVYATGDKTAVPNEEARRKQEEIALNKAHNKAIMRLRNEYLHWNAYYGEGKHGIGDTLKQTISQAYEPNFEGNKRKREVR
jgi:hypothetical protein